MRDYKGWLKERLHTILLATDFNPNSGLALVYAAEIANRFESKLTALNAFEFGPHSQTVEVLDHIPSLERRNAEDRLEQFIAEAGIPNVPAEVVAVEGFVTSAIIKALSARSVDLLVIGTEGVHEGLNHLLVGSTTEALMLGSRCLTLTVGPHVPQHPERKLGFQKIVCISDFSVASIDAAEFAFALSAEFGVETELYQLASKAARKDALRLKDAVAHYCDVLRFTDPDLPAQWFDHEFQLSRMVPEAELMTKASEPSNLIVLGVQPASFLQRHLHSSLAYRLLAGAASPVLTVPAEAARGRAR
jgi:nucleotide-binding universal stress UspA family protein